MNHLFLKNPELDLENIIIKTDRCTISPFCMGWIDFNHLTQAFCGANENFFVSQYLPTVEQEREFISWAIDARRCGKAFECFVFDNDSWILIGAVGINAIDTPEPNLWLWIHKDFQRKWYGTEIYTEFLGWVRQQTSFTFLKHTTDSKNTWSIRLVEHFQWRLQDVLTESGHLKYYIPLNA